jgi:hypothetical protein
MTSYNRPSQHLPEAEFRQWLEKNWHWAITNMLNGNVGIGTDTPSNQYTGWLAAPVLNVHGSVDAGIYGPALALSTDDTANDSVVGSIIFGVKACTAASEKRSVLIMARNDGSNATAITGDLEIYTTNSGTIGKRMTILANGNVILAVVPEHADNGAAVAAGLAVGTLYRTGDALKIVHA